MDRWYGWTGLNKCLLKSHWIAIAIVTATATAPTTTERLEEEMECERNTNGIKRKRVPFTRPTSTTLLYLATQPYVTHFVHPGRSHSSLTCHVTWDNININIKWYVPRKILPLFFAFLVSCFERRKKPTNGTEQGAKEMWSVVVGACDRGLMMGAGLAKSGSVR